MKETFRCCICKQWFYGYGNNPRGAEVALQKPTKKWKDKDRCCDECDGIYVIPGRLMMLGFIK